MLHFDLWYKGKNVLVDVGSYSYNPSEESLEIILTPLRITIQ